MTQTLIRLWPAVVGVLTFSLSAAVSVHAILHKRDTRAAVGWVAVIWFVPLGGAILYLLLGINRIRRRATELRRERLRLRATTEELRIERRSIADTLPPEAKHLVGLARLVDRVTRTALTVGNRIEILRGGEAAFPAMIQAIDEAEVSVGLATYIFDNDIAGMMFADALERAVKRGIEVRVLIDSVGARYSWPPIVGVLRRRHIRVARFLHSAVPWRMPYMNLRSHRKILVTDGRTAFTGGMNIRAGHMLNSNPKAPVQDVHFRVEGPVVSQMTHVFAEDWAFATRELLDGDAWLPYLEECGPVLARGIPDGPDEDMDKLRWTIHGAVGDAMHSIRIVTPYFLPEDAMITSLNVAAMRGVDVEIVLPEKNNLPFVKWATSNLLSRLLSHGCSVVVSPPPFDHSKVMIVDSVWSTIGSANWDPRSLRLNFEFNVECYDARLAQDLGTIVDEKVAGGRRLTLADIEGRGFFEKLRDGIAGLASPYL
jgi:cardiolipin synthase